MIKIRKGDFIKDCYLTANGARILSASTPKLTSTVLTLVSKDINVIFPNGDLSINIVHYANVVLKELKFKGCRHISTKPYEGWDGERRYEISIAFDHMENVVEHTDRWEYYD